MHALEFSDFFFLWVISHHSSQYPCEVELLLSPHVPDEETEA